MGDQLCNLRHQEAPVEAKAVTTRWRLAYWSTFKAWKVPLKPILRLPSSVLIQRNCGRSLGCLPPVTTPLLRQLAVVTARKQAMPSEWSWCAVHPKGAKVLSTTALQESMPVGRPMPPLRLSEEELRQLQCVANSSSMPGLIVQRALIVLSCGTGESFTISCQEDGRHIDDCRQVEEAL